MNWQESDLPGSEKAEAVVALADKSGGFGSEISLEVDEYVFFNSI